MLVAHISCQCTYYHFFLVIVVCQLKCMLFRYEPEKARLQAAEAAENASRQAEVEAVLEVKRKRDLEREGARQALFSR